MRSEVARISANPTSVHISSMLPELPTETWERAIDYLWNEPADLRNCALVCKAWYARSKYHLVATTTLGLRQTTHRFAKLLDTHPQLRARVKVVVVLGTVSTGETRRPIPHFGTFASMLAGKLPSLGHLGIGNAAWQSGTMHRHVFVHLSTFVNVAGLHLVHVTFPSKIIFGRLVCALPNLRELSCQTLIFRSKDFHPSALSTTPPRLATLHLDGPSDDVVDLLVRHLRIAGGLQELRAGWVDNRKEATEDYGLSDAIATTLQHTGSELKRAYIRLRLPPAITPGQGIGEHRQTLTLGQCAGLEQFAISFCLQKVLAAPSRTPQRLYSLLQSINSSKLWVVGIRLDTRLIDSIGESEILTLAEEFLEQQRCVLIDEVLSSDSRFASVRYVWVQLMCASGSTSPDHDSWQATIQTRLPKLHARRVLSTSVRVWLQDDSF
ncbi:uncharacterized protein B0H18DRAFT_84663 [Fomitopsis serialis]|uniref:uncharacterized protein n=1 Tax=Fomitopsis serialis TaxID=139415 RepID=UPI002007A754|nr:uncharacterized protein B0H18DRAFT_84663 [Neoantrodia serialis]KAH9931455.1 hypothetical protein B0H18DRAFT_84663 [Neoantrodia serialis]